MVLSSCGKDKSEPRKGKTTAVFNPDKEYGTVTDIDGNEYKTITIGTQTWMAENLRVTHYQNGDPIPNEKGEMNIWQWGNLTTGAYCSYKNTNDVDSIATNGLLYNGYAAIDSRGIAPPGWHVPTEAEWDTLIEFVAAGDAIIDEWGVNKIAGGRLKEAGTLHWGRSNRATNSSGFTAVPGGVRYLSDGTFAFISYVGGYWANSEINPIIILFYSLDPDFNSIGKNFDSKATGRSIRCIKD